MLGNSKYAIRKLQEFSNQDEIGDLYDLRDWGYIVKKHPENKPAEFDDFLDLLNQNLNKYEITSIFKLSLGKNRG